MARRRLRRGFIEGDGVEELSVFSSAVISGGVRAERGELV
jgi:hypothetical protein